MITSLGVGSGLDTRSLVDDLVAAERAPTENRLNLDEARLEAEVSAFGALKSSLSSLEDSLATLGGTGAGRTASVSTPEALSASAEPSARVGRYSVEVSQLAGAHALATAAYASPTDAVGTGTLTIALGTHDFDPATDTHNGFTPNPERGATSVTIDASNNTLEGVRDAINEADAGVNASIVNDGSGYRLLFTAEEAGAANGVALSVADAAGGLDALSFDASATNLEQTVAARDAELTVNGLAITSPTNSVSEAIEGLTLDLQGVTDGQAASVDVGLDKPAVKESVNAFVDAYNKLAEQLSSLTSFNAETQQAAVLLGDSTARGLESQLRSGLVDSVEGASETYGFLVSVGVSTEADGKLKVDEAALDDALEADFEGVATLIAGAAENLQSRLAGYTQTGGALDARTEGIQSRIGQIDDRREALDRRIGAYEQRLVDQFSGLDSLLGQLQQTGDFLARELSNLPGPRRR